MRGTEKRQKICRLTRCEARHQDTKGKGSEASGMSVVPVCEPQPYKKRQPARTAQASIAEVRNLGEAVSRILGLK